MLVHICTKCGKVSECLMFDYQQVGTSGIFTVKEKDIDEIENFHNRLFHICEFCHSKAIMKIKKAKVFVINES